MRFRALWRIWLPVIIAAVFFAGEATPKCGKPCDLALASFVVWPGAQLNLVANHFNTTADTIVSYNTDQIPNKDSVQSGITINIPFSCGCLRFGSDEFLGHAFDYDIASGDTYERVVSNYSRLTTVAALTRSNPYDPNRIPNAGRISVPVNCSCGDRAVSDEYGLFITYPLKSNDSLQSIVSQHNVTADLLQKYNPSANFGSGSGFVFIPHRGMNLSSLFLLCGE